MSKHLISFWAKLSHRCKRLLTVFVIITCQRQDGHKLKSNQKKANLHYTPGITTKRLTSNGIHLRGLARGQHSFEEKTQKWRAAGYTVFSFTRPGFEP